MISTILLGPIASHFKPSSQRNQIYALPVHADKYIPTLSSSALQPSLPAGQQTHSLLVTARSLEEVPSEF